MLTTWWGSSAREQDVPIARRQATRIYSARADARARIAKSSPTLQHSETWIETLCSLHEYMPPHIWWFVNVLTTALTLADIYFSGDYIYLLHILQRRIARITAHYIGT